MLVLIAATAAAQLVMPNPGTNPKSMAGRRVALTDIEIRWSAPGVKGREGNIWGTPVAHYGYEVLGFGSNMPSPWRAGADECTTISFSTDVTINGKALPAGKYAFFIALGPDTSTLIFSKNTAAWGSYFYDKSMDVLYVPVSQEKNRPQSTELLTYTFSEQTDKSVVVALEWERWRIPFTVGIDLKTTALASIRSQMSGALGFDPPSLIQAATWCLQNDVNTEQALGWAQTATDPNLGGQRTFAALSTQAGLLDKLGKKTEAEKCMDEAVKNGAVFELHGYGRRLIAEKKYEKALDIFKLNYQKHGDAWPTHVGLARGYSGVGDVKQALEHAKIALSQAPDDVNRRSLDDMVKQLSTGKPLAQ